MLARRRRSRICSAAVSVNTGSIRAGIRSAGGPRCPPRGAAETRLCLGCGMPSDPGCHSVFPHGCGGGSSAVVVRNRSPPRAAGLLVLHIASGAASASPVLWASLPRVRIPCPLGMQWLPTARRQPAAWATSQSEALRQCARRWSPHQKRRTPWSRYIGGAGSWSCIVRGALHCEGSSPNQR